MDYLKRYANAVGDYVTSVLDEPDDSNRSESTDEPAGSSHETKTDSTEKTPVVAKEELGDNVEESNLKSQFSSFLGWMPELKTAENTVVNYVNSLASFGSEPKVDQTIVDKGEEKPITEDLPEFPPPTVLPSNLHVEDAEGRLDEDVDVAFMNWVSGMSSRTGKVWEQMKQDLGEVVNAISTEPKGMVTRTAASVRQHLTTVADAAKSIDPNQFTLLPESTELPSESKGEASEEAPQSSHPPTLASLRSDVGSLMSGIMSTLFGAEDEDKTSPVRDRREARLQILRADPATYEREPSSPPVHLKVHSYTDWRAAYFDEATCQPMPGIPICTSRDNTVDVKDDQNLIASAHPSPEELLEQHPFMRTYLSQLVRVEGHANDKGISDADFWSRYYYRVWLLDVTEQRRQRLAQRVGKTSIAPVEGARGSEEATVGGGVDTGIASNDWSDLSDNETSAPLATSKASVASPKPKTPVPGPLQDPAPPTHKSGKRASKPRKRRGKKRSEGDQDSEEPRTDDGPLSSSPPQNSPMELDNCAPKTVIPAASIAPTAVVATKPPSSGRTNQIASEPKPIADLDENITSGSSSVVVVSNSDADDEEQDLARKVAQTLASTTLAQSIEEPVSDDNSDDWGELHADDVEASTVSITQSKPLPELQNDGKEADDWDSWA